MTTQPDISVESALAVGEAIAAAPDMAGRARALMDRAMVGTSGYARNERDLYQTEHAVTEGLCRTLLEQRFASPSWTIWEPACGEWRMCEVLEKHFKRVIGSDIVPLDRRGITADYLISTVKQPFDAIITNPPYYGDMVERFITRSLHHLREGRCKLVAMLCRGEYDHAVTRSHLFKGCPEYAGTIKLTWRPRWVDESKGSPRHNYAWFIWTPAVNVVTQCGPKVLYAHKSALQ